MDLLFFSPMRWQDVFDIVLNSYILFRLYVLFRGTYVFRVVTVIALLWFAQRIAVSLELIVTSWALQGITAVAALIIILVFRNEIRSVLQTKNLKAILWGSPLKSASTPLDIVVSTIYALARKHCGALLVFPGREDLSARIQGGVAWNGSVSREMIASIFWPGNPVHDGGAVIRGDQITQVGVILPLTNRSDVPTYFGTRHRAAMGLAESTDALVVVVSEERGQVIVAQGSEIYQIRDNLELTRLLQDHVGDPAGQSSRLRRRRRIELGLAALVSLLFITGIWFSFSRGFYTLTTLEVPVEYMNRDPGIEILDTSVDAVRLQLSGSGTLIKSLRPEKVQVRLDLAKAVVGRNSFTITHENISLPPGVVLKEVLPTVVEATLDLPVQKELPVQVDWVGKLASKLILSGIAIDPATIVVIGPGRILKTIDTLYTEKIPLDNIKKSATQTVALALHPAALKIAPDFKDKVEISYRIDKKGD